MLASSSSFSDHRQQHPNDSPATLFGIASITDLQLELQSSTSNILSKQLASYSWAAGEGRGKTKRVKIFSDREHRRLNLTK